MFSLVGGPGQAHDFYHSGIVDWSRREFSIRGWPMQLPDPVGPTWNLRLFRRVSLVVFLASCAGTIICLGLGKLAQAAAAATSAVDFACNWQFARHYTVLMEKWGRRPGYGQSAHVRGHPRADASPLD